MREPGDILLLSTYELGHPPLALAVPLAFLERAGFRPVAQDLAVARLDEAAVRRARLVAISVPMHTALRLGVRAAERVRALNPEAHLVCYGLYAPLNAEYLLAPAVGVGAAARPRFDAVLGGECEAELVALAERLERGEAFEPGPGSGPGPGPGPGYIRPALVRLDFPVPSRAQLPPLERYAHLEIGEEARPSGYTEASRGCKHLCRHCPIPPVYGGRFFVVPVEVVLADVRQQVAQGARHVTLGDADFLNGPGHALRLLRALHAEFPALTFDATIKVEHILAQRRLFPEMARLGLVLVTSAVESVSEEVLRILDKGHTRADVVEALRVLRAVGVALRPSLLPFTPWSSLADYLDLLEFLVAHDLVDAVDPVQLSIRLLVPPGSLLLERPEMRPHLGDLDAAALSYQWRHPDPRMDELQRRVSVLVEEAARKKEEPHQTFDRLARLAHHTAGHPEGFLGDRVPAPSSLPRRPRPPRLSEAWFC
jgi:radical SAM superfamily enzyme YgiQ (UPF0313 family)